MEFVFSANEGRVPWGDGGAVHMRLDDVWWADDPFVQARPDLFSQTPAKPHSTTGREYPQSTPVEAPKRRSAKRG